MTFHLPTALLDSDDDTDALDLLRSYYGRVFCGPYAAVGASFDTWDSTGTRHLDADHFTADDLVAVTFLSVDVPATAARSLLRDRAAELSTLLTSVGPDRDLVDEAEPLHDDWAGWVLMRELRKFKGVDAVIASKLFARKRPRLRPIWDKVVAEVTGTYELQWEPLRVALREGDGALHRRLLRLRTAAGLPEQVSPLRVLDVIAWREGKNEGQ